MAAPLMRDVRPITWYEAYQRCDQWNAPVTASVIKVASNCNCLASLCFFSPWVGMFGGLTVFMAYSKSWVAVAPGVVTLLSIGGCAYSYYEIWKYRKRITEDEATPGRPYLNSLLNTDAANAKEEAEKNLRKYRNLTVHV